MTLDDGPKKSLHEPGGENELVRLDPDHPGFRDPTYRARRNAIARLALDYREGDPPPLVAYTDDEHAVWRTVWENLEPLHRTRAIREWREGAVQLSLDRRAVPQLVEVDEKLKRPGMQMLPVAGLITARGFLSCLGRGVFLSTQYMRHHSMPLYTPEPDVIHELVGHATSFFDPDFVRLSRLFGEAALVADAQTLVRLERVYWYTLEFGLAREGDDVKAYGAGLLSSYGELGGFESRSRLEPFDLGKVSRTPYDPTRYQEVLFVAGSFRQMAREVGQWLEGVIAGAKPSRS
jgi:phenylalanine-4-hydroxylase